MKNLLSLLLLFVALLDASVTDTKVSLQLLWLNQFQFAGYYMAKEKGFYRDVGLDVELKPYYYGVDIKEDVVSGKTTFGIGRPSLIRYDSEGKKVVLLSAIFQSTPNVLITLKSSEIKSVEDFRGKVMMQTNDLVQSASISAMLQSHGLDITDVKFLEHSSHIEDLIDGKVDIYSGYISNEPYLLKERGIAYRLFSTKAEGFDLYSDILFTSKKYLLGHPDEVKNFNEASLKGWRYAFSHIKESVEVILKKYNTQHKSKKALLFEAEALKKLAYHKTTALGKIDETEIQRIYDLYNILGVIKEPLDMQSLLYSTHKIYFTKEEEAYLEKKGAVKFCTQPDSMPYSAIQDHKLVGIGAEVLELIQKNAGINFELFETKSWRTSLQKIAYRECDILPMAAQTTSRNSYVKFTDSYYKEPLVLVTREDENYIIDVHSILDKEFSVVRGNAFMEILKQRYRGIKIHEVDTIDEALHGVESGKYFAHIDVMMRVAYKMQHNSKLGLKINGQFEELIPVCFAVRSDDALLYSIMNKIAKSLTLEELQIILNRWVSVNYTQGIDYWYFREIGIVVMFILIILLYREYFLKKKNIELQKLKDELLHLNSNLALKISEAVAELELAQDMANIGSWIYNMREGSFRCSKQAYKIFEIDEAELQLYLAIRERIHDEDIQRVESLFEQSLQERRDYSFEYKIVMDDARVKYIYEKGKTTFTKDGIPIITYATVQDVTDKVLAQKESEKKDAYLLYQSRLALMGEMLSMIAHQWKQPLSSIAATQINIKTTLELEKYNLEDAQERKSFRLFLMQRLDKIALYVQNLALTIKDFSDYYKPNKESQLLSIDTVVIKSIGLIEDTMIASGIKLDLKLHAKKAVEIHSNEFIQVILNLLHNAKDQLLSNSVSEPKIEIRTYETQEEVIVEIEDNGGGISKEVLLKIFDPYFSTKLEKNGTGLGLYMCKMIVEEHHKGDISVYNTENGALFTIKLQKER